MVPKGYSNYEDPKNEGQLITLDNVKKTNDAINEAMQRKDKGSKEYRRIMRETGGHGRDEAKAASHEVTGGGVSKLWDDLCKAGHVICLVVRCPRCDDHKEMYQKFRGT